MSLHGLSSVTIGVPNVEETAAYYTDFGLARAAGGWFNTVDGGSQLRIVHAPTRRLVELRVAADDTVDLGRAATNLGVMGLGGQLSDATLATIEPVTGTRVYLDVAPRLRQNPPTATVYNGPGRFDRTDHRAPGFMRPDRVRPRKLGHAVLGSVDYRATMAFFVDGLGFKVSDRIKNMGAFMRCSTDHHNILVLAAPVNFLHHTSWQVDDVDDVGRGAYAMLEGRPERHVWGLGRHFAGSNFFWYLKDPAGNFSEYYSDMDCIVDDQLWTPEDLEGARGLFAWGPPPPPSFLEPEDLAAMMTGSHATT
jgi:catechol 2,3-dioxygenase-like lactoylglutathione lyase family enzyme